MRIFLDLSRHVSCLCFPLAKKGFELNFSERDTACRIVVQVHLTHCMVRTRFDSNHKKEAVSRSVILLRELFRVINIMFTKSFH